MHTTQDLIKFFLFFYIIHVDLYTLSAPKQNYVQFVYMYTVCHIGEKKLNVL